MGVKSGISVSLRRLITNSMAILFYIRNIQSLKYKQRIFEIKTDNSPRTAMECSISIVTKKNFHFKNTFPVTLRDASVSDVWLKTKREKRLSDFILPSTVWKPASRLQRYRQQTNKQTVRTNCSVLWHGYEADTTSLLPSTNRC